MTEKMSYKKKVNEFKKSILPASSVLIVTHDYPDPDCIASSFGIQQLLLHWGIDSVQIAFGGFIGRAENRAMIRFTNIQTVPLMLIDFSDFDRIILVDSFPGDGNVSLKPNVKVDAVIDHHPPISKKNLPFYHDIKDDVGSTSTIITQYLKAEKCKISKNLATALFYGIKTDTHRLSRNVSSEDIDCYKFLFDRVDHLALSKIELPDRDAEYFNILHRSAESMTLYEKKLGHTHLGTVSNPDYIAEMADLFHSLEALEWMLCSGIFKNQIFFSIRSKNDETAGIKAEKIAKKFNGSGGGHNTMAAGRIPVKDSLFEEAVTDFIDVCKIILNIQDIHGQTILR
jgi:nanoRNase/pAp phosphatase (c-di-AMP/oligoRNAs hydrolase)